MPYKLTHFASGCPASKPYAVVRSDTGALVPGGCHETKQQAQDHMAALYVNVTK